MGKVEPNDVTYDVYLSVGSNIEPRRRISVALRQLKNHVEIRAISPVYRTRPVDMLRDVEPFHNLCVAIRTALPPRRLKSLLLDIEREVGRSRKHEGDVPGSDGNEHGLSRDKRESVENGYESRPIDLDILLYRPSPEDFVIHPQVFDQAFVIYPLSDLIDPSSWDQLPASHDQWRNRCDGSIILGTIDYAWPEEMAPFVCSPS